MCHLLILTWVGVDRKSTRLNSSHANISYAVFCLKKKNTGTSSQDVTYTLELNTTGANFKNPLKQEVSTSNELSRELTVKELNSLFTIFFFNETATTEIYTLSLHDALPISGRRRPRAGGHRRSVRSSKAGSTRRASPRSEEHTSELQSRQYLVCRLLLDKKKKNKIQLLLKKKKKKKKKKKY